MNKRERWHMDTMTVISLVLLAVVLLGSLFAPILTPYSPTEINMDESLLGISSEHLLGTDFLGRDLFTRILYGGRVSVMTAIAATALSMLLGLVIGLIAGYFGGGVDAVLTCITSIFQGLPSTSMMIAVSAILEPGIFSLLFALVINSWASFSRIVRENVLAIREETYVEGARCMGAGRLHIIVRYIIPNMLPDIIVLFTTKIGGAILSIAALSYLGLGIQPPTPDWGMMISEARSYFRTAPRMLIAPGVCIMSLSFGINYLGEMLRNYFDVKSQTIRQD